MLELHCVSESFVFCGFDVALVSVVVLRRRCNVPAVNRVIGPSATFVRILMYLELASHWGQRRFLVVGWAVHVSIS